MTDGERLLEWATRWLSPDDVERIVRPTVADWRHEVAGSPPGLRAAAGRRGRRATIEAIVRVLVAERLALASAVTWWLLALPAIAVMTGVLASGGVAPLVFLAIGALSFAVAATTPARWVTPAWAWAGVGALALTLTIGETYEGATRWLTLAPLHVEVTMLVLPLLIVGGRWPAAVAAGLLAAAPDALASTALAVAVPHPLTITAAVAGWLREPAMTTVSSIPVGAALASSTLLVAGLWRYRMRPAARLVMAIVVLGLGMEVAGHASMPLVAPGGSAIVATCVALGWIAAKDDSKIGQNARSRVLH